MAAPKINREEILNEVKELISSTTKPSKIKSAELEIKLAGLHSTLPMRELTKSDLKAGNFFYGYLLDHNVKKYVRFNGNNDLAADGISEEQAIVWNIYISTDNEVQLQDYDSKKYLRWYSSGQCTLGNFRSRIGIDYKDKNLFNLYNYMIRNQQIGTRTKTDLDLYCRLTSKNCAFHFVMPVTEKFTEEDHMIYNAFMNKNSQ